MKDLTLRLIILTVLLLSFSCSGPVAAQEEESAVTDTMDPAELIRIADQEIFPKSAFSQDFHEDQGYVNEYPTDTVIHQYFIYDGVGTDRLFSLLPAAETVTTTNKRLSFAQTRRPEFHITYSLKKSQEIPAGNGGRCWIRFSDVGVTGAGFESGIILYPGDAAYYFTPKDGSMTYEKIADLSSLDPAAEEMIRFDFIRLENTTRVYADGSFIFSYTDPIINGVSFEAGAELFENGNVIRCDFDDFSVKVK